ncbi:3-deoxy-7-phosphoheptulonate synthase class II [Providencia alcalifaciens]|uniref:3-deoxy-7-phosphoheptulonate synthase class II n=1 Tax=Providencia alcalifaciens TaxID=126385 RepID=UPI002B061580|nr:3-deoxy-7-phosphoheptulonate synthase class II [Providencia alcalifaciens]
MLLSYDYDVITGKSDDVYHKTKPQCQPASMPKSWIPSSWKLFPIEQDPNYPDKCALEYFQSRLQLYPPLVLASEIRAFKKKLCSVTEGKAFILQGGDCAESFDNCRATAIRDFIHTVNQMSGLIQHATNLPIIKIGRIAGQYAKPRSSSTEILNGVELPSYRGEIINGIDFNDNSRIPDPHRMINAYHYSSATLNLIRALNESEPPNYIYELNFKSYLGSTEKNHYGPFLKQLLKTSQSISEGDETTTPIHISHEALLLPYEESMTKRDSKDNKWYNCSAHMVWVGDRTRDINQAHIEYLRGIENPIGIKCGLNMTPDMLIELIHKLNPVQEHGKIILIIRMGADVIKEKLPPLVKAIQRENIPVIWMIDPMHGNTKNTEKGYKTRDFVDIFNEMIQFIQVLKQENAHPGGLHLEMTGEDVTECIGGLQEINTNDILYKYRSLCDPRLNRIQSLELAYLLGEHWHS